MTRELPVNRFHSNSLYVLRDIIIYHLTFLWFFFNVVFLMTISPSQLNLFIWQTSLLSLSPILVDTISREVTRIKTYFNNLLWVSYSSRSVIIIIYFPWNVISKQYFSWTVMRPISHTQRCVSGNVYNLNRRHRK